MRGTLRASGVAVLLVGVAGWTAGSCGPRPAAPAPEAPAQPGQAAACAPVEGTLAPNTPADALAGKYRLALVAASGPAAGRTAAGRLTLRPFGAAPSPMPAAADTRYPLFGGAEVALAEVGAVAPGDIRGSDPARPGVLVLEWRRDGAPAGQNEITVRLGAEANRGGPPRFDGARMALFVTSVTPTRFAGRWESGGRAGGYFCADRV